MDLETIKFLDKYIGIPICCSLIAYDKIKNLVYKNKKDKDIKKILFIKFFGFGNLILILPPIKAVEEAYPNAEVSLLTILDNKGLLEEAKFIDKIIYLNVSNFPKLISSFVRLIKKLREEKLDIIFDFEQFARVSSTIVYLSGAKERVGFDIKHQFRGPLYTTKINYNNDQHMVKSFCDIVKYHIKKIGYNLIKLPTSNVDRKFVEDYLSENSISKKDFLVGIHVGSGKNAELRRWPKENFAKLADYLINNFKVKVLFTGSKKEKELVNNTLAMMKNNAIDTTGQLSLRQLSLIIERCNLFICVDSGPLHLASAMKTPSISFFGPNTPVIYGPIGNNNLVFYKGLKCSPCISNYNAKSTSCRNPVCLNSITYDEVKEAVSDKYFKQVLLKP